jgi:hypothetical protein
MAQVIWLALAVMAFAAGGYPQQSGSGNRAAPPNEPPSQVASAPTSRADARREQQQKLVRDAYVRLMRYHTAGVDEQAATGGASTKPEDYVIFELRDLRSGPIAEVAGRPLAELMSEASGEAVKVTPHHLQYGKGPKHAYYDVQWSSTPAAAPAGEQPTVAQVIAGGGERLADVDSYTGYEVTVRLAGKTRSYRALALHHRQTAANGKQRAEILDAVTSEMNAVLADESPPLHSPWKQYVKTGLYLAVEREIRQKQEAGEPLIPAAAPLGYLPGDDALPDAREAQMRLAVVCAGKSVTVSGNPGPNDGDSVTWTATVTGGTAVSYAWSGTPYQSSGTGNNPNVTFSSTSTATTTTNAHWFAYPDQECGAQAGSTYTIKCKVHFADGDKKTGEALMTVYAWWYPAGYVDPNIAQLTGFPAYSQGADGMWRVTGMGSLTRVVPTDSDKHIEVPTTSQFYQKTDRHEQVHVDNWKPGNLYGDVFQPSAFYDRVKYFVASNQQDLVNRILDEFYIYRDFEWEFIRRNHNQDERLAYAVSDLIAPRYLYQNCGNY